jgi:hypothetical protein
MPGVHTTTWAASAAQVVSCCGWQDYAMVHTLCGVWLPLTALTAQFCTYCG